MHSGPANSPSHSAGALGSEQSSFDAFTLAVQPRHLPPCFEHEFTVQGSMQPKPKLSDLHALHSGPANSRSHSAEALGRGSEQSSFDAFTLAAPATASAAVLRARVYGARLDATKPKLSHLHALHSGPASSPSHSAGALGSEQSSFDAFTLAAPATASAAVLWSLEGVLSSHSH